MSDVNFDLDEDVKTRDFGVVDGDEAAMAVVNEKVGIQGGGGEVVDAAGAVSDVAEDEAVGGVGEGCEDVGEDTGVHEEAFRELESKTLCSGGADAPHAFVDLEVVVLWEESDGGVERRVVEDGVWDLALHESFWRGSGFGLCDVFNGGIHGFRFDRI